MASTREMLVVFAEYVTLKAFGVPRIFLAYQAFNPVVGSDVYRGTESGIRISAVIGRRRGDSGAIPVRESE